MYGSFYCNMAIDSLTANEQILCLLPSPGSDTLKSFAQKEIIIIKKKVNKRGRELNFQTS